MLRMAVVTLLGFLVVAAPAEAAFESCTYDAATHTVTATFGAGLDGTLQQSGTEIRADGAQCGEAATTGNTDTIRVVGDADEGERLTISLAGGTFAGGFTGEPGSSDEVEIEVDLKSGFGFPDVAILGTPGVDRVTLGETQSAESTVNLNAGEADGIDADVTFSTFQLFEVRGGGAGDVLSGAGGDGTGDPATQYRLYGEAGDDDLATTDRVVPGPGDDTVRFPVGGAGIVEYTDVPVGTTVTLEDGSGGDWGGATDDGEGGEDTYVGNPDQVVGSDAGGDTITGSIYDDFFFGLGGADTLDGGGGDDVLNGNDGGDTARGGAGDDEVRGGADSDGVLGDDGNDIVDGGNGDDDERGGAGDDRHRQSGVNQFEGEETEPNGADDVSGGPGTDTLEYGDPTYGTFGGLTTLTGRVAPVTVDLDDVADDGAAGEGDNAQSDVENVIGGVAGDTLTGDDDVNVLSGFDGADTLRGLGGDDALLGLGARGAGAAEVEADVVDEADDFDGGPGADRIDANEGDDRIEAREGTADTLDCGAGFDSGRGDRVDAINADCEAIDVPAPPQDPTPPGPDQTAPPVTTTPGPVLPGPGPVVPPVQVVPAPKVADFLSLPSTRRCASRRRFRVRVRRSIRSQVRRVTIFVNGRRKARVTGRRVRLPVDLRGLPKGRVRVRLRVELADGRVATDTRRYRTCTPRRRR